MQFVFFVLCLVLSACVPGVRAQDPGCYTSGSIAGIVIATIVVTLVMAGLAAAFIWYLWKQRKVGYGDNKSLEKPIVCPPMSPDKQMIARESNDYAFDNPYFKDDEIDHGNMDAAEKGESGFRKDNGDIATPVQNAKTSYDKLISKSSPLKTSNGTAATNHHKKSRPFSSLPFHAVFHPSGKKQQRATMDDTYISKHLERITVPLRGHDFTGLGFNICGNMRDGIFVKDVLHRGPASESGKIKAGDRIVGVTVSFAAMVYEDALTILSYASPYDVRLEIEKAPATSSGPHLPSSSPRRLGASTSFRNQGGQRRLFHPLYRSQSIDDLTQIGKDGFGTMDSSGSQRDSSSSATPKRSQSVEASNGGTKARPPFLVKAADDTKSSGKGSRTSSVSSCESTAKATTPTEKTAPTVVDEETPGAKREAKSARFRAEKANVTSEVIPLKTAPPAKPARETHEEKNGTAKDAPPKSSEAVAIGPADLPADEPPKQAVAPNEAPGVVPDFESDAEKPTAPPRKASATPKRKAPAPPPALKTETSAVVHRADDLQTPEPPILTTAPREASESQPPPPPTSELPLAADESFPENESSYTATHELRLATPAALMLSSSAEKMSSDPGIGSSDASSLASGGDDHSKGGEKGEGESPGKRKASSLGDLTKLEQSAGKKASTSSAILERAVSLDLQQSIPGENLTKQKRILRAPAFEDDYLEDREDLSDINGQGLKRWDDGLDIVFAKMPNGETNSNEDVEDEVHNSTFEMEIKSEIRPEAAATIAEKPGQESSADKPTAELEDDSPVREIPPPPALQASVVTSTPVKRIIEVKNLNLDDSSEDDDASAPTEAEDASVTQKLASNNSSTTTSSSHSTTTTTTLFSPVTISIPVIKPDLTHFEKLPSPPPASTHPGLDSSWRMGDKPSLERISVQSLYKPLFASSKDIGGSSASEEPERMVNGNESDASEHYSTAHENTSTSSVDASSSSLSVTVSSSPSKEGMTPKTPNTIAGFAKTLILPGPNEVDSLLSLAEEPVAPPEQPPPPTGHE